jgi:chromosome partitioning protein
MSIIAIANQKGGVGKTTLTIHLAVYLARRGKRVLVIDADPQGNTTSWLMDGDVSRAGLFQALVLDGRAETQVRHVDAFGVDLLPGNYRSGEAFLILSVTHKPFDYIAGALRPLATARDVVLIDMPPSRNAGFEETLFAADWVLVPCQLERLSMEGVGYMANTCVAMRQERRGGPALLGVVPNMTRANTLEHQAQMTELITAFGPVVWPPIPLSVRVAEAASHGATVWDLPDAASIRTAFDAIGERVLSNAKAKN